MNWYKIAQLNQNQGLKEFLKSKINAYHVTSSKFDTFNIPAFFTTTTEDAEDYLDLWGGETMRASLNPKKTFMVENKQETMNFIELIRRAGYPIDIIEDEKTGVWDIPEEQTQPISDNSPYSGINTLDWVYVPKVMNQLLQEGYDSIKAWDVFLRGEMNIIIVLDSSIITTEKQLIDIWNETQNINENETSNELV